MKYNMTFRMLGIVLNRITKKEISDKGVQKNIAKTYRDVVDRASDIGEKILCLELMDLRHIL